MGILDRNKTDPHKILPIRYKWAREYYKNGIANNWVPEEIPMQDDVEQWKSNTLSGDERRLIKYNLGFFSTAESLTANNLVLAVYNHITDPACRQYLLRQAYEESIHCYIEGTEILTEDGFKDFRDLKPSDLVGQYEEDGTISFVKPHSYYKDDFSGDLIKFSNQSDSYSLIVTPDHRCVTLNERKNDRLEILRAEGLSPLNRRFPVSGNLKAGERKFTDWDRLRIACQADGSIVNKHQEDLGSRSGYICWSFNLKKQRKKKRLLEIASRLNLEIKEHPLPEKHGKINHSKFRIWVPIEQEIEKNFDWVKLREISFEWIRDFIDELKNWDGSGRNVSSVVYCSNNKSCIDKVKLLAHLAGFRAGLYISETSSGNPHYQVHIHKKGFVSGKIVSKEHIHYEGKVYCVGVPSGMLVVRYQDKIAISGNTDTFIYCCDTLGLDPEEIYTAYTYIPSIKEKDDFVIGITRRIFDPTFSINNAKDLQDFLYDLIGFYVIMEGIYFYAGFAMMLALKRQKKMTGIGEQFEFILRDEAVHLAFGCDLINTLKVEHPDIWKEDFQEIIIRDMKKAVELESKYAYDACPRGLVGINAREFCNYVQYIADRRFERLGLPKQYETPNPFPWMSQATDLMKEKNFFETRVTEYQSGTLEW